MNATRNHGFTLIEMMISLAIFSIVAVAVSTFIIDSQRVNYQIEAQTSTTVMGESALGDMRWRLEQSRMLLDSSSHYVEMIDLGHAPPVEGKLVLPRIQPEGALSPRATGRADGEFDASAVGNALLFAEALPPFKDPASGTLVDRSRFVLYYVAEGSKHTRFGPLPDYVDLVRFESAPYADFAQLDSLRGKSDDANPVITALEAAGVTYAWQPSAPSGSAFSRLSGGRIQIPPEPHHLIKAERVVSAIDALGRVQTGAGSMDFSLATNTPGDLPIHTQVPRYAKPSNGFPNGFEVQITGPSHGRKVLARLVLVAHSHGSYWSREALMFAAVWD